MATSEMKIVIELLRNYSEKFNRLKREARKALHAEKDAHKYSKKMTERGQLLIDLQGVLAIPLSALKGSEQKIANKIEEKVAYFARDAKNALEEENDNFSLATLLTHQGSVIGDKNDLEKLIEYLENK